MRICYLLLSPTFGLHQYTADLANRMENAQLVTTTHYPSPRYAPGVTVHTRVDFHNTGTLATFIHPRAAHNVARTILEIQPDLVHITGPHIWNLPLLLWLKRRQIPTIHTLHDLDPHPGRRHGYLLNFWNRYILHGADHILVHGKIYRKRLFKDGYPSAKLTYTPLLFLFLGYAWEKRIEQLAHQVSYDPFILFFGRFEEYKGIDYLIAAWNQLNVTQKTKWRLVLAGKGSLGKLLAEPLPTGVEIRNHFIDDSEALDLFQHCSLVILPYTGATQSSLIAAAYFFHKPVIVTQSGALPEYVEAGKTGWIVPAKNAAALANSIQAALSLDPTQLQKMGENGQTWYQVERLAEEEKLRAMYEHVSKEGDNHEKRSFHH